MDRMPAIAEDQFNAEQRVAAEELSAGPRGGVIGPFVPLLRSPELMRRVQKLGEYLRYQSALPPSLSEWTILIVARYWSQDVEWQIHHPIALKAGVDPEAAAALAAGIRPSPMSNQQEIIYDFCTELCRHHVVSDTTYARALQTFREHGVIDLTALCGYYSLLAMVMNVAQTPAEGGFKLPPVIKN